MSLDDGGTITAVIEGETPVVSVDESNLPTGSTPNATLTHATGDFSGAFTHVNGADGATITYAAGVSAPGVDSGLIDSLSSQHVLLSVNGSGVVEGRTAIGGDLVFTIGVNGSGVVTLTDFRSVHQGSADTPTDISEGISLNSIANLVTLTATITDADGDHQSATLDLGKQLSLLDDGPSISVNNSTEPVVSVDESNLPTGSTPNATLTHATGDFSGAFTHVNGADGATITYAVGVSAPGVDSGLIDSLSSQHVLLSVNGSGVVEGRTAIGGDLVFTIGVNGSGVVTLTDFRSVHQGSADTPTDISEGISLNSIANLVTLTATITDADGDHQSATLDLGKQLSLLDDGPSISVNNSTEPVVSVDESFLPNGTTPNAANTVATGSFAGAFTHVNGADGATITYAVGVSAPGVDSGLIDSLSGNHVFLFLESGVVVGREGTTSLTAATGPIDFTLSVNSTTGVVTLSDFRAVHEGSGENGDISEAVSLNSVANLVT